MTRFIIDLQNQRSAFASSTAQHIDVDTASQLLGRHWRDEQPQGSEGRIAPRLGRTQKKADPSTSFYRRAQSAEIERAEPSVPADDRTDRRAAQRLAHRDVSFPSAAGTQHN
jgi:hypothetical protein